jgi:AraC-like DNA-binding protein
LENPKFESALAALAASVGRWTEQGDRRETLIPGLSFFRREQPTPPISGMYVPGICLAVQGAKRVLIGKEAYVYGARRYLITSVDIPSFAQIIRASPQEPYLGLRLRFDLHEISQLMTDRHLPPPLAQPPSRGLATGEMTMPLLSAFQRLIDLLADPQDIPILAPVIQREISYRLLVGDQGAHLRQMATVGSRSYRVAQAIDWLKSNFARPFRVDDLASRVSMSKTTFHRHFRTVTAMSPLQYQKRWRLNEAKRLMLTERLDTATAALQVGYESASQFSREYARMFGAPPLRDIMNSRRSPIVKKAR